MMPSPGVTLDGRLTGRHRASESKNIWCLGGPDYGVLVHRLKEHVVPFDSASYAITCWLGAALRLSGSSLEKTIDGVCDLVARSGTATARSSR